MLRESQILVNKDRFQNITFRLLKKKNKPNREVLFLAITCWCIIFKC